MSQPRPAWRIVRLLFLLLPYLVLVTAFGVWIWFGQSLTRPSQSILDLGAFALAIALTWRLQRNRERLRARLLAALCAVVCAWILVSIAQVFLQHELRLDAHRFERPQRVPQNEQIAHGEVWKFHRVGLALSGGGYRAAVYHAGVLHALDRLNVPITNMVTVSGGSIIGAYYANGGTPSAFKDAVRDGRFNLRRELALLQNASRLPLPHFSRVDVQAALIRRMVLADLEEAELCRSCPQHMIAIADLNFAFQIGMMRDAFLVASGPIEGDQQQLYEESRESFRQFDLARRVAMSGAFPGAFPPTEIEITVRRRGGVGFDRTEFPITRQFALVDGGLVDNSGLLLLRNANAQSSADAAAPRLHGWETDVNFVSDAGAIFGRAASPHGLQAVGRAVDVMSAGKTHMKPRPNELNFAPSLLFRQPRQTFNAPTATLDESGGETPNKQWFDPFAYPDAILRALVELLGETREDARRELHTFLALRTSAMPYPPPFSPEFRALTSYLQQTKPGQCACAGSCTVPAPLLDLAASACRLKHLVRTDVERRLLVFAKTPTLRDQLGASATDAIFGLGQQQVLLSWPLLKFRLTGEPLQKRPAAPLP